MNGKSIGVGSLLVRVSRAKAIAAAVLLSALLMLAISPVLGSTQAWADDEYNGTIENSDLENLAAYPLVANEGSVTSWIADSYSPSDSVSDDWYSEDGELRCAASNVTVASSDSNVLVVSEQEENKGCYSITAKAAGTANLTVTYQYAGTHHTYKASETYSITVAASANPVKSITLDPSSTTLPFVNCKICSALGTTGVHYDTHYVAYTLAAENDKKPTQFYLSTGDLEGIWASCEIGTDSTGTLTIGANDTVSAQTYSVLLSAYDCADSETATANATCSVTAKDLAAPAIVADDSLTLKAGGDSCLAFSGDDSEEALFKLSSSDDAAQMILGQHWGNQLQLLVSSVESSNSSVIEVTSEQESVEDGDTQVTVYRLTPKATGSATITLTDAYGNTHTKEITISEAVNTASSFELGESAVDITVQKCPVSGCESGAHSWYKYVDYTVTGTDPTTDADYSIECTSSADRVVAYWDKYDKQICVYYDVYGEGDDFSGAATVTVTCKSGSSVSLEKELKVNVAQNADTPLPIKSDTDIELKAGGNAVDVLEAGYESSFASSVFRLDTSTTLGSMLDGWHYDQLAQLVKSVTSSNESVLKVEIETDSSGTTAYSVKPIAQGTATITLTDVNGSEFTREITISENANLVTEFSIDEDTVTLSCLASCPIDGCGSSHGDSQYIDYTITAQDGSEDAEYSLSFSYGSDGIVEALSYTWGSQIELYAKSPGTTTVTVTCKSGDQKLTDSFQVTVTSASGDAQFKANENLVMYSDSTESLIGSTWTDETGVTTTYGAFIPANDVAEILQTYHNGQLVQGASSSDESVVKLVKSGSSDGDSAYVYYYVNGVAAGTTDISFTDYAGKTWTCSITVKSYSDVTATDFKFADSDTDTLELAAGESVSLYSLVDMNTMQAAGYHLSLRSSDETKLLVDNDDLGDATRVYALAEGKGTLTLQFTNPDNGEVADCDTKNFKVTAAADDAEQQLLVTPSSVTLAVGDTQEFKAVFCPTLEGDSAKTITWSIAYSYDANGNEADGIASIDSSTGKLTASKAGAVLVKAKITGSSDDDSMSYSYAYVTITDNSSSTVPPASVAVSGAPTGSVVLGSDEASSIQLTATVSPDNATDQTVSWSSSDESVATIDSNGKVTVKGAGSVTFTATCNGDNTIAGTATMTVVSSKVSATGVTISEATTAMSVGNTQQLTATVEPSDATDSVVWSSSDTSVLTVDASGKVTAVGNGTAKVTATAGSVSASTAAIAVTTPVSGVALDASELSLSVGGGSSKLTATVSPTTASDQNITWTSSDESVATVDQEGNVTPVGAGSCTITATTSDGGKMATCAVTVTQPVEGVSLDKSSMALSGKVAGQLTATVSPASASEQGVTWASSDESVATVDASGKVTPVAKGSCTITATSKGDSSKAASCSVTVKNPATTITLDQTSLTLAKGEQATLAATLSGALPGAVDEDVSDITWSSSDEAVATVSAGTISAVASGSATITASVNGITATCAVRVPVELSGTLAVAADACAGKGLKATASLDAACSGATLQYQWFNSSTDEAVSEVSSSSELEITDELLGGSYYCVATDASGVYVGSLKSEAVTAQHSFGDWTTTKEPTCTDEGSKTRTCSACGVTETQAVAATGHDVDGVAWSSDSSSHWKVCGTCSAKVSAGSHTWGSWTTTKAATALTAGSKTRTCSTCGYKQVQTIAAGGLSVSYTTHVQDYGWQSWKSDGALSGTTGKSKRLEGLKITLKGNNGTSVSGSSIQYRTHVQDIGWQGWKSDGALSGTTGRSKRLEAVCIRLTGEAAQKYDVYYRVHAQDYGWLGWAKNGEAAGTQGFSKRLEGLQIVLVEKGGAAPGSTSGAFVPYLSGSAHVQDIGWSTSYTKNSSAKLSLGTTGKSKRVEGIKINVTALKAAGYSGSIQYCAHVQDIGWQGWKSDGAMAGTTGQSKRLEAIKIKLTGDLASKYDVYYRGHAQDYGWLGWAKNGEAAGTEGKSKRLESVQVVLVPKGSAAPGSTSGAFIS